MTGENDEVKLTFHSGVACFECGKKSKNVQLVQTKEGSVFICKDCLKKGK